MLGLIQNSFREIDNLVIRVPYILYIYNMDNKLQGFNELRNVLKKIEEIIV